MVFLLLARKRAFFALVLAAFLAFGAFRVNAAFFALRTGVASHFANQFESELLFVGWECEQQPNDFGPLLLHGRAAALLVCPLLMRCSPFRSPYISQSRLTLCLLQKLSIDLSVTRLCIGFAIGRRQIPFRGKSQHAPLHRGTSTA